MKKLELKIGKRKYKVVDWEPGFSNKYCVVITFMNQGIPYVNSLNLCTQAALVYTYDKARAEKLFKSIPENNNYSVSLGKEDRVLQSK